MSMHKTRTRVDKDGVPYTIQDVTGSWSLIFNFKLFNGAELMLTYELIENHLYPLPYEYMINLVETGNYPLINELLGDWIWKLYTTEAC